LAQAQINQADKLYKSYSYSLAIPLYLKIAQKPGDPDRNYAIVKLADCYRQTNDQLNAKAWYSRAVNLPNSENINWFYYGEALQCAQEYDLAKEAFEKYDYLNPQDPRGKAYASFCAEAEKLSEIPPAFEIKHFNNLNSERSDFGPAFYGDGIIFVSDRRQNFMDSKKYEWTNSNYLDLYFATPQYLDEFFQEMNEPKSFSGKFNQTYHDGPASFSRHDSLLYLTRTEKGKEKKDADNYRTDRLKIFYSKFNGSWSKTEPFFLNSDNYSVGHPVLTPDGNTIYFVSDMPGGLGGTDIYTCEWKGGQWDLPVNLGDAVNSFGDEMFPAINGDQLYFASNGLAGFGGLDIFRSTLANGKWSKAENVGAPINSSFDDFAMVLDARGKKGFFSSNRPGGKGSDDIYACKAIDPKKLKKKPCTDAEELARLKQDSLSVMISGYVKDKQTLKPIPGTTVFLLNTQTGKATVLKTDANGQFKMLGSKGVLYVVKGMENNYLSDCFNFTLATTDTAHTAATPRDILLDHLEVNKIISVGSVDYSVETIYYDFNKWFIRPEAAKELDKLVQVMKENPVAIELGSHTDSRGSKEYNLDLSQKRAESAVRYIVLQGIDASRITAKGYGETQPINHCTDGIPCSAREHQANRRTEFKVTAIAKARANSDYDMSKFASNEEIPAYLLDQDFFIDCLQDRRMSKSKAITEANNVTTPVENKTQPAGKTTVKESKQLTEVKENKPVKTEKPAVAVKEVQKTESAIVKEKVNEPVPTKQPATVANASAVTYRVQIFALSREKSLVDPEFEDLLDVQMYYQDGMYKYTTGVFDTHEEAQQYRAEMVRNGFSDAFVVSFANGKRIYVSPSY
jgi:outer membrane protein OmpA-like peptidoglycan-associated protein/tetratricopeptide (TPR) repeat protein